MGDYIDDYDELAALLRKFGIPFEERKGIPADVEVVIEVDGWRVRGYSGFHVVLTFNGRGKFVSLGIWD